MPLTTRVTPTGFPVTEAVVSPFRKLMLAVFGSGALAVAVGMRITPHPPRGSGLEELPHPALALGHDALAA